MSVQRIAGPRRDTPYRAYHVAKLGVQNRRPSQQAPCERIVVIFEQARKALLVCLGKPGVVTIQKGLQHQVQLAHAAAATPAQPAEPLSHDGRQCLKRRWRDY